MSLLDLFRSSTKRKSAIKAKERLQVIIAHGRSERNGPEYFPRMKQELLEVIKKYTKADNEDIKVTLEKDGNYEILEMNVTIPSK
jgi:cell division topological specificity factor